MSSAPRYWGIAAAAAAFALLPACPRDSDTKPKPSSDTVRVRSFTEATPVTSVEAVLPYGFTATARGLDRWDLRSGQRLLLTAEHGLPGDRVFATALDRGRGWLWVATDGGVTRYDIEQGVFTGVPPAPTDALTALVAEVTALAPAGDGGVWLGSGKGLAYTDTEGAWKYADVSAAVTSLLRDHDGSLWIGTSDGGVYRRLPDGNLERYGAEQQCGVSSVRFIVEGPDGAPMFVGDDDNGKQRIAVFREGICATFRASPSEPWIAATRRGEETVVMTRRKMFGLALAHRGARRLSRDGMRLIPLAPGTDTKRSRSPYLVRSIDARVPVGAFTIATAGEELLIGTRDLGTAVVKPGAKRPHWLRRGELGGSGQDVSVACTGPTTCYVATGGKSVWKYDGEAFHSLGADETVVLSVARGKRDAVYALYRILDEARVRVARIDGPEWQQLEDILIETPGTRSALTFAKVSPRGMLWLGLGYTDADGEERSYGVAEIDVSLALVAYHHASYDETEADKGVLPIPISVADIAFLGDEVWLASNEGVVRIAGQKIQVYMESEGLVSELVRSIAVASGGIVFAATGSGVGVYDGEHWSAPAPLRRSVNAVAIGREGHLWMATPRGVATYDGARVRRLDSRRGLLDDDIADIEIDRYGRIWALSKHGLSIVTP